MNNEQKKWIPLAIGCAGAAAAGIYAYIKGSGPLNRMRFRAQHDAAGRYLESRRAKARYSPIEACDGGWHTLVTDEDDSEYELFMTSDSDGMFVFSEYKLR